MLAACSGQPERERSNRAEADTSEGSASKPDNGAALSSLLAGLPPAWVRTLDQPRAERLARLSLTCLDQEYPNKPSNVLGSDSGIKPPRELHPAFFGCFDWHSAVHGHWALVRILRLFPGSEIEPQVREVLNRHLTAENIAAELVYFQEEHHDLFERPYGWAWLLRLTAELATWDDPDGARWADTLDPLARHLSELLARYLDNLSVPVRAGTHHSTAYALTHVHDYAAGLGDSALKRVVEQRSRELFGSDTACPTAYEPSGEDFISPCLVEADLMRRVMARIEFANWLDLFLPPPTAREFAPLAKPPLCKNRHDPRIGHLIGLSFQRAAAFRGIAQALKPEDDRKELYKRLSALHRDDGLAQMFDSGYSGEHWLASFAIYLLTGSGPYDTGTPKGVPTAADVSGDR